jgi:DNA modification methylase
MHYDVINGECSETMASMAESSVDAIVCDPPYGLSFMGAKWDSMVTYQERMTPIFEEALRVAKPGAHMLCFGGTRTFHRMACAIEDAGWEIRDTIMWVYGSGFPKSLDVGKAIDKALGAKREQVRIPASEVRNPKVINSGHGIDGGDRPWMKKALEVGYHEKDSDVPVTDQAKEWDGWGTQIKPAWESVVVAQKVPDINTVIQHLEKVEECLYKSHVRIAESNSIHTQTKYGGVTDGSAHVNAQTRTGDSVELTIQAGMAEDTSFQADTSGLTLEAVDTALNMISSWKSTLEEACELTSKYTTEMVTSLTTDLRTWSCCLLQITPDSIIMAVTNQNGSSVPVSDAVRLFSVVRKKLNAIHILTAQESVTWDDDIRPALELITVARKPLDGTVARNVMEYGTGAINVDACRVPTAPHDSSRDGEDTATKDYTGEGVLGWQSKPGPRGGDVRGRFPANLVHDGSDEVLELFPDKAGQMAYRAKGGKKTKNCYGNYADGAQEAIPHDALGSAARFFYCAKASKSDRNLGGVNNDHISVKPNALMRWLVRLVCPKGGLVLDPFMGSGSTGVACMDEGMSFVGIELDGHYCDIAKGRIEAARQRNAQMSLFEE